MIQGLLCPSKLEKRSWKARPFLLRLFKKLKFVCPEREVAVVKRIGIEGMDFLTPGVSAIVKDEVVLNIQGVQEAA